MFDCETVTSDTLAAHYAATRKRMVLAGMQKAKRDRPRPPHRSDRLDLYSGPIGPKKWLFIVSRTYAEPKANHAKIIIAEVAAEHGMPVKELLGPYRKAAAVRARHEAMWRLRQETMLSLPQIGRVMGGRDHTTILHGIQVHESRLTGVESPRLLKNRERMREAWRAKKRAQQ